MKAKKWMKEGKGAEEYNGIYMLRLFITGASPNSVRAVENIKTFCEKHLKGNYQLEIIDIYQRPEVAREEQIIALPLLIKNSPAPQRRLIGDLSNTQKLLECFNVSL
jgi:circadian clock protein KaiB